MTDPLTIALRLADHACAAARDASAAAVAAGQTLRDLRADTAEVQRRLVAERDGARADADTQRARAAMAEDEARRLRVELDAARAATPAARARVRAAAGAWDVVGDVLRHPRVRGAAVLLVVALLAAVAMATAEAIGVEIPVIPALFGAPNAPSLPSAP